MSALLHSLQMIAVEHGVFDGDSSRTRSSYLEIQTKYAGVIPLQQVIARMDGMSDKRSPPREV